MSIYFTSNKLNFSLKTRNALDTIRILVGIRRFLVILFFITNDQGMEISFQDFEPISLNPKAFYTLYGILTAKKFRTYNVLILIATCGSGQEVSDDYIRQIIRRLARNLPYWGHIIETTTILHPDTRRPLAAIKLADGFPACILCRVEDFSLDF
jgi:hypothetical protein